MTIELNKPILLPYKCVPILEEFKVGQTVSLRYNGGLGGVYPLEGVICNIDRPEFDIIVASGSKRGLIMADIVEITLLKDVD